MVSLFSAVCFLLVVGNGVLAESSYLGNIPLENPDLFGGDILGVEDESDRNAIVGENRLWPGGIIPYVLDDNHAIGTKASLPAAIFQYKLGTCIKFVPRTNEKDYIRVFAGQGCYSHVGKTGGMQPVSIGLGCTQMPTIIHELGHAVGFYHEQNRSDRDDYLIIYWENIKEGAADQFIKLKPEQNILLTEFDYNSIMLYGGYTFSKDRKKLPTMAAKKGNVELKDVYWKYTLSAADKKRINMLYKCDEQNKGK